MDKATALIISLGQASVTVYLHSTADDENQLVWVKARIGVSQAISQETTEDSGETIGRVPNTAALDMRRSDHSLVSKRLFPPGPPHRHNDH